MSILKNTIITASTILAAGFTAFAQQATTVTYSFNGLPLPVLPDYADVISVVRITVPRALKITKVTAQVQAQYPNIGDLNVFLYSPQGTRVKLLEHNCGSANIDTTFDDAAQARYSDACPAPTGAGTFRGNEPLSNFNSDNSSYGIWRLAVENNTSDSRSGWVTGASLTIEGTTQATPVTTPDTIVNTASLTGPGTVAPGELVSIFGVGMGPTTSVSAPSGALPTTLGGTTVTINGNPAPIAYTSAFRTDVQIPFTVVPGTTIAVQVNANNQASLNTTLNVVTAVPGLYTLSTGGPGPVKAVNQSGALNSVVNPALKGSVITVYASGLGSVNPAVATGAVPPNTPLSRVTGDVGGFIGGAPATVQFAGLTPGTPGLYQVNIQIPASAPSGVQELLIYSNGVSTQSGVTIVVQ